MTEILIDYSNEQSDIEITENLLSVMQSAALSVLKNEGLEGKYEISLTIADEPSIKQLNFTHRGIDSVTDVLSFPLSDSGEYDENFDTGALLLGDIVICAKRALEQAEEYGHSVEREFGFLCAHSVLHLLGYDHVGDKEQAEIMENKQRQALDAIGLKR